MMYQKKEIMRYYDGWSTIETDVNLEHYRASYSHELAYIYIVHIMEIIWT